MAGVDRDAEFTAFVAAQRPRLVRAAFLLTGGRLDEAEDLVQTVLVRLYRAWSRVRRVDDPVTYSMRAVTNGFIDAGRRAHRRRELVTAHTPDRCAPGDPTAEVDLRDAVLAALEELPPGQRAVVVLRHFVGYDVAGTAAVLGVSHGTVKSQNAKALTRLRRVLGDQPDIEEITT